MIYSYGSEMVRHPELARSLKIDDAPPALPTAVP